MGSDVSLYQAGGLMSPRQSRRMARELERVEAGTQLGVARIDQAAELQAVRIQAVGYVGKRALHEVALVSQTEQQLAALVPIAAGRLQAIGDMTALSLADVVSDTLRKVR